MIRGTRHPEALTTLRQGEAAEFLETGKSRHYGRWLPIGSCSYRGNYHWALDIEAAGRGYFLLAEASWKPEGKKVLGGAVCRVSPWEAEKSGESILVTGRKIKSILTLECNFETSQLAVLSKSYK